MPDKKSPELVALVDMDGTTCDLDSVMSQALFRLASPNEPVVEHRGPTDDDEDWLDARKSLIKKQPGFWRNLPPYPPGMRVYQLLLKLGFRVHILTKGPFNTTSAWTEKVEWCREHVPEASVTITEDKGLVYGKVLVDDWPPYVKRWLEWRPRGLVIMPAWPWNADFTHPNVIRFDGTNWEEVESRLEGVRRRTVAAQED